MLEVQLPETGKSRDGVCKWTAEAFDGGLAGAEGGATAEVAAGWPGTVGLGGAAGAGRFLGSTAGVGGDLGGTAGGSGTGGSDPGISGLGGAADGMPHHL